MMKRLAFIAASAVLCLCEGCHEGTDQSPCDGVDCGHGRCVIDRVHARCDCDTWFVADEGLECGLDIEGQWALIDVLSEFVLLGSPDGEAGRNSDELLHQVVLTRSFAIMATEVSQQDFAQRMDGETPSAASDCSASCPVENVTWHRGAAYCNVLSREAGVMPCYDCSGSGDELQCSRTYETPYLCPGFRYPTEAEWEFAARAGTETATYNGDLESSRLNCQPNPTLTDIAWYCAEGPRPVGDGLPNAFGLFDMLGNVAEWCDDGYDAYPSDPPVTVDPWSAGDEDRVVRGGAFDGEAGALRAAARASAPSSSCAPNRGFRPVVTLEL